MIDLSEIEAGGDGFRFERFVESLLECLGWRVLKGAGVGPDGGRDILAARTEESATGRVRERTYVVQCKHYGGSGRSVGQDEVSDCITQPARHCGQGWLLVTSSRLTEGAVQSIDAARSTKPEFEFGYWDSAHLERFLLRDECREVLKQYLPKSYSRCAGRLMPQPSEVREIAKAWLSEKERYKLFSLDFDFDESLLSFVAARSFTLADVRTILSDEELTSEFLAIWSRLKRGETVAPAILLLEGLARLRNLRAKRFSVETREQLLCPQILMMSDLAPF